MNQFPIGMEMFSAADDDQWKIIKEAIDSSDFMIMRLLHQVLSFMRVKTMLF